MVKMKIRFIVNPKSGASRKEHFVELINSNIDATKFESEIIFTDAPGHATTLAREAANNNYDMVIAVGGDGSVNETGIGLMGSQTALGIIPTGSGNGMARHLKIPIQFKKAVQLLNNSKTELIDTLTVNDHFCIGTFGVGFDAHIAHLFAKAGKRGYSTYVKLVLTEFSKFKSLNFKIFVDNQPQEISSFLLTFANSSQFGNNAVIAPFADVKDGIIDISILKKFPFLAAPQLIYQMMNNALHQSKYFDRLNGTEIVIENESQLKAHIDGEPIILEGRIFIIIKPLSLKVVVAK